MRNSKIYSLKKLNFKFKNIIFIFLFNGFYIYDYFSYNLPYKYAESKSSKIHSCYWNIYKNNRNKFSFNYINIPIKI